MPFAVSPGVNVSEIDLTTVVPAVSSTEGAIAGVFHWGPMEQRVLITSEDELVARFGKPTNDNDETFFTAASFLAYANKLYVVRAFDTQTRNAVANSGAVTVSALVVKNEDHFTSNTVTTSITGQTNAHFIAKYPGKLGNALSISVCGSATSYESTLVVNASATDGTANTINLFDGATDSFYSISVGSNSATVSLKANTASIAGTWLINDALSYAANQIKNSITVGDLITIGNSTIGTQKLKVTALSGPTFTTSGANTTAQLVISFNDQSSLKGDFTSQSIVREWEYKSAVSQAPGISTYQATFGGASSGVGDELHIVVADRTGAVTGVPGTVLEVYEAVSRARDSKTQDGSTNYYKDILTQQSAWVWPANDMSNLATGNAVSLTLSTSAPVYTFNFAGGVDTQSESEVNIVEVLNGYDMFASASQVDISLLLAGKARGGTHGEQIVNYLIDNVAEKRKDCVVFASPSRDAAVDNLNDELTDIVLFRNAVKSSSYAVLDSGYKYTYDKYNDVYRYVPLNGDIAGLCVRTDSLRDPWWSPAGFNRGQIKNIIKLSYNPSLEAHRDVLYQNGINPVVTFPGQGTILYGDKTLLNKPSAFNRINVRRLFITLEKAIATAAKFTLFEFNDEFTRSQFRNLVEPFLRDVQGRRGITDFRVVCDTTNNTGEVIDRNEFVGDIYIKPVRSINFIQLNFVAVRTGVEFSEIVGKF